MSKSKIYIQISAGRGPAECCWVVAQVLKYLLKEVNDLGLNSEVVDRQEGVENGTLFSALMVVTGDKVDEKLGHWQGTIQWIGQSPYRKFHKRKNWFVGVTFFKHQSAIKLDQREVVFKSYRASGPGGQHRNKVETAIRATHVPTGISATAADARSQHQNKQEALKKLQKLVEEESLNIQKQQINDQWMEHLNLERGNAVMVFEGRKFQRRK